MQQKIENIKKLEEKLRINEMMRDQEFAQHFSSTEKLLKSPLSTGFDRQE